MDSVADSSGIGQIANCKRWKLIKRKIKREISDQLSGFAKEKFIASLKKNPEIRLKTMYVLLVLANVEKSSFQYKLMLGDQRQNLTFSDIKTLNNIASFYLINYLGYYSMNRSWIHKTFN